MKHFVSVIFAISLFHGSFAKTILVGPQRDYKQLQSVTGLLDPGDTVLVDGNASYAGGVSFSRPGSAERKIFIKGVLVEGKRPSISNGTNTVAFISDWPYTSGADHYVFEGFDVSGGSSRGIYHQADDLTIRDCIVHDCPAMGILGADQGSGSCVMEFCEVYKCGSGDSLHQIYMSTDEVNHPGSVFRMQYCFLHDGNGGNNVKSRSERNEIYYNWIEGAYYHELELIGPDPGGVADEWTPRLKREDSDVVGNVLFKRKTAANNDANFSVTRVGGDATGESHGRYRFVNNTVVCGSGAIFRTFDSLESVETHNNVFYRAGGGANLVRMVEAYWTAGKPVITGSNNWVVEGSTTIPEAWTGTLKGSGSPFMDFEKNNLRPAAGSSLIDNGNRLPQSSAGFEFPSPLALPSREPPVRMMTSEIRNRSLKDSIDIGAFSFRSDQVLSGKIASRCGGHFVVKQRGGAIYWQLPEGLRGVYSIALYTINGKQIVKTKATSDREGRATDITRRLGANGLSTGYYLLQVTGVSGRFEGDFYYYR
jgi:hypothetical protein